MGLQYRLTEARLAEILRRQDPPRFGPGYEPSIKPTREEAPSSSRPAAVWVDKLGRDVCVLSRAERSALAVIVYCCPTLFELHEQRMLPFLPGLHPLHGHPLAAGLHLPPTRGTLQITHDLGYLKFHPVVHVLGQDGAPPDQAPGCWIGDFLAFLTDEGGPYCVNINVKSTRSEFEAPQVGVTMRSDPIRAQIKEKARHETERVLYSDHQIRTVEVAADELPHILIANLFQLIGWQKRRSTLSPDAVALVIDAFNEGLEREASPLDVICATELSHGLPWYEQKIVFHQAVFFRKLRLDLIESHLFIDRPMRSETQDAVEMFEPWFRRWT
ncbi:hypothetical protein [Ottowia testudinis]|uniref:Uncharacterized protein n=1 Tax=Ottowia testudinis TaxID=2816950 RepID=A0A975CHL5_9BURK|nr:hypothetical protein [Ottowia testudinis]QTD46520.1 hypothetical protein J1M35_06465 [Ottowia testudinis]